MNRVKFFFVFAVLITGIIYGYGRMPNSVIAANQFSSSLVSQPTKWSQEPSGSTESITKSADGWVCQVGGEVADTHYARIKYKLPEQAGIILTTFYQKTTVVLPPDFYSKQVAYFRIMNTDNYGTTLNGAPVGASTADEFRTGVYLFSDHTLRIRSEHENHLQQEFYRGQLPVGEHVLELYGDVANAAPWWFKIDGVTVASGIARLSPDSVPVAERVITRLIGGIDGAASYDSSSVTLTLKDIVIANYDMSSGSTQIPSATPVPSVQSSPSPTPSPVPTKTPTPTSAPLFSCPPPGMTPNGSATYDVSIPQTGNYKIWIQMMGKGDTANSLYVQLDNLFCAKAGDLAGMPSNAWSWVDYQNGKKSDVIPSPIIAAGKHTIRLYQNSAEPGVLVDRMLLTRDTTCVPAGNGDSCIGVVSTPTPTAIPIVTAPNTPTPTVVVSTTSTPSVNPSPPGTTSSSPVIQTESLPRGKKGTVYSATIVAIDPSSSRTLSLTATRLPNGMSMQPCTQSVSFSGTTMRCNISGIPAKRGTYYPLFTVINSAGLRSSKSLKLQIK